jgi:hypothetical protein
MNTVLPGKSPSASFSPLVLNFLEIFVFEEVIFITPLFPADLSAVKAVSSRE